jgi:hypothetical protein
MSTNIDWKCFSGIAYLTRDLIELLVIERIRMEPKVGNIYIVDLDRMLNLIHYVYKGYRVGEI